MTTILLIRHAENDFVKTGRLAGRMPGVHLNEHGQVQAQGLGKRLAHAKLNTVYSSPLERALETAGPIAKDAGLKVVKRPELTEIDYGAWQGKTLKQLRRRKLWPAVQNTPSLARFPEGESFAEAQVRICEELIAISKLHKPRAVVAAVSHADIIKLAAAYFLGLPLDQFQRLIIFPASITTLHISEHGARLINLNLTEWKPE